ncbi:hypothetical protein CCP4SC76_1550014 [Gammaproteobacteria bacterium]
MAAPTRETEAMRDGSDAISDWVFLNALINAVNGASWVSVHHGGGVGMGYSQHAGVVIVADGTPEAEVRLRRVLNSDPASGVMRHADAGLQWPARRDVPRRTPSTRHPDRPPLRQLGRNAGRSYGVFIAYWSLNPCAS